MSFEEFVLEFQPQASSFCRLSQAELLASVRLDGVVRFGRLDEDCSGRRRLRRRLGGKVLEEVPWLNRASHQRARNSKSAGVTAFRWQVDLKPVWI